MTPLDRRSLLAGAVVLVFVPQFLIAAGTNHSPHILLICQFGTVKSPIARELLKRRAAERNVRVEVAARGITPQQHITAELLSRLTKDGINPAAEPLKRLGPEDIAAADLVIAFDKLPAEYHPKNFEDWSDLPSMVNDYDHARAILEARIDGLLDRISAQEKLHR
jgi:protein-tyrosine-phosphatase